MMECERSDMLAAEPRARFPVIRPIYPQRPRLDVLFQPGRMENSESMWRAALASVRSKNGVFFSHEDARLTEVDKPRFVFD